MATTAVSVARLTAVRALTRVPGSALMTCCAGMDLNPASTVTYEGWANFTNFSTSPNTIGAYDNIRVIGTGGGYTLSVNTSGHITARDSDRLGCSLQHIGHSDIKHRYLVSACPDLLSMRAGLISYTCNGVQDGMVAGAGTAIDYSGNSSLPGMRFGTSLTAGSMTGSIDEHRVSTSVRSADWLKAEYNNQSNPTTFAPLGAEN